MLVGVVRGCSLFVDLWLALCVVCCCVACCCVLCVGHVCCSSLFGLFVVCCVLNVVGWFCLFEVVRCVLFVVVLCVLVVGVACCCLLLVLRSLLFVV